MPSRADKQDANYCPYHRRNRHTLDQCITFRRIQQKTQDLEIIFQKAGDRNGHEQAFPNHNNNGGKRQVMMVSTLEKSIEEEVPMHPESKSDLDKKASTSIEFVQVQTLLQSDRLYSKTETSNNKGYYWVHRLVGERKAKNM